MEETFPIGLKNYYGRSVTGFPIGLTLLPIYYCCPSLNNFLSSGNIGKERPDYFAAGQGLKGLGFGANTFLF